jgi:hypothetical protein
LRLGDGEREFRTGDRDPGRGETEGRGDLECARFGDRVRERSREMLRDGDRAGDGLREGMINGIVTGLVLEFECRIKGLQLSCKAVFVRA